jgi:2-C-methyl-D-erythritol 4-phosphate cytidylyltransferase
MTNFVIVVAGGIGRRMNNALPKQFIQLENIPVLMRTLHAFHRTSLSLEIVVVLPAEWMDYWTDLCYKFDFHVPHSLVEGGTSRFQSVKNGLNYVSQYLQEKGTPSAQQYIAVHDGARPLVSSSLIATLFAAAAKHQAVIPGLPSSDTIRLVENGSSRIYNRDQVIHIQTPQVFEAHLLFKAYQASESTEFTDDASVVEASGTAITIIPGEKQNFKITTEEDLLFAKALLRSR